MTDRDSMKSAEAQERLAMENDRLRTDRYQLRTENQRLRAQKDLLRAENERLRHTLIGIRDANWRTWDNASADEFVAWAKSRARHVLQELPNADVVRLDAAGGQSERT